MDLHELGAGAYPEFVTHTDDFFPARRESRITPDTHTDPLPTRWHRLRTVIFSIQTIRYLSLSLQQGCRKLDKEEHK